MSDFPFEVGDIIELPKEDVPIIISGSWRPIYITAIGETGFLARDDDGVERFSSFNDRDWSKWRIVPPPPIVKQWLVTTERGLPNAPLDDLTPVPAILGGEVVQVYRRSTSMYDIITKVEPYEPDFFKLSDRIRLERLATCAPDSIPNGPHVEYGPGRATSSARTLFEFLTRPISKGTP